MSFWFESCFDASPLEVFSYPFRFSPSLLPPFYKSLLAACRELDGSFLASRRSLVFGSLSPHFSSRLLFDHKVRLFISPLRERCPTALCHEVCVYVWSHSLVHYVVLSFLF